jgi:hypothetical protein
VSDSVDALTGWVRPFTRTVGRPIGQAAFYAIRGQRAEFWKQSFDSIAAYVGLPTPCRVGTTIRIPRIVPTKDGMSIEARPAMRCGKDGRRGPTRCPYKTQRAPGIDLPPAGGRHSRVFTLEELSVPVQ